MATLVVDKPTAEPQQTVYVVLETRGGVVQSLSVFRQPTKAAVYVEKLCKDADIAYESGLKRNVWTSADEEYDIQLWEEYVQ